MAQALCPGKLSRTDCATVTHLYKLRPNTEQRHAIRTVRNIVRKSLSPSASHREKYAPAARHYGATMPARYNIVLLFMLGHHDGSVSES